MDQLDISVIIAQAINFAVLLFVFNKFLWAKIIKEIEDRKAMIAKAEASDKEAKELLENAEKDASKIIDEARAKWQDIVSSAEDMASKKSNDILAKAEKEAKSKEESALRNVEKQRLEMLSEMRSKVSWLVIKLNEKLFWEAKINKDYVEKEIDTIKL